MAELTLDEAPAATRLLLQGGTAALPALGEAFGLPIPTAPLTAIADGPRAALWLGPEEWLLLAEPGAAAALTASLEAARGKVPASLVDVSHRQVAIDLAGAAVPRLLAEFCPLDLDDPAFPPGCCSRSVFAKAEILLWRRAPAAWRLEVTRSFAPYVRALLREAAADL